MFFNTQRPDYMTEQGARYLVRQLLAFWKSRGKAPSIWAEPVRITASKEAPDGVYWIIRSNIVNGLPL